MQLCSVKTDILEMVGAVKEELKQLRTDFDSYRMAHPTSVPTLDQLGLSLLECRQHHLLLPTLSTMPVLQLF